MIQIKVFTKDHWIDQVEIKGHSNYAEAGYDIVCASCSSMVITTVNAILRLDEKALAYQERDGYVWLNIYHHDKVIDSLLANLMDLLQQLEVQYPHNLKIIK